MVWNDGTAYFFKGSQYVRYDIAADGSLTSARVLVEKISAR